MIGRAGAPGRQGSLAPAGDGSEGRHGAGDEGHVLWRVRTFAEIARGARRGPTVVVAIVAAALLTLGISDRSRAAPPLQAVPVYREFGDWIVGCDETRRCMAKLAPDDDRSAPLDQAHLTIWMDPGPQAEPELVFGAAPPDDDARGIALLPLRLRLDGVALPSDAAWEDAGSGEIRLRGEAARALLGRVRDGSAVTVAPADGHGATLSLQGLAATLLLVDAVQGRVGTVSALGQPGPGSAAGLAPPVLEPVLRAAPVPPPLVGGADLVRTVARIAAPARRAAGCDTAGNGDASWAQPLTGAEALVALACDSGAYQTGFLLFRVPRNRPAGAVPLRLPVPPLAGLGSDTDGGGTLMGASFDPARGVLSSRSVGRGLGDCGEQLDWVFDGRRFQLAFRAAQERCGGNTAEWPILLRSLIVAPKAAAPKAAAPGASAP
ncbi:DUF1176 domain-containing protein [Rhizosaccharibacter radicis]|uniref:DUF1176 domain-containing protein n=1 Tax=Rhizosaccharibacter radicis TaxID=2782605 RepID=A0ABT1W1E8_9PROT|nr:DUF1176 domain-containing protein [Acetobacteraceae bacterium KSS12]